MATTKLKSGVSSARRPKKSDSSSVSLKGISKSYGEEWASEDVLKNISVDFPAGEKQERRYSTTPESTHAQKRREKRRPD
jgi:hypothetical protein